MKGSGSREPLLFQCRSSFLPLFFPIPKRKTHRRKTVGFSMPGCPGGHFVTERLYWLILYRPIRGYGGQIFLLVKRQGHPVGCPCGALLCLRKAGEEIDLVLHIESGLTGGGRLHGFRIPFVAGIPAGGRFSFRDAVGFVALVAVGTGGGFTCGPSGHLTLRQGGHLSVKTLGTLALAAESAGVAHHIGGGIGHLRSCGIDVVAVTDLKGGAGDNSTLIAPVIVF